MGHAAMKLEEKKQPIGYRVTRTTVALAAASATFRSMQNDDVRKAIAEVQANNYDFDRTPDSVLETIYAVFDDETMARVKAEFEFIPGMGAMRHYGGREGTCALCGKGDSRDDGMNEDKLIYAFRLSNTAGGADLWVGSTCIVNHHLKVRGADTSEDAKRILEKSLREHLAIWKIETWRAQNPGHVNIPAEFDRLRRLSIRLDMLRLAAYADAQVLLGHDGTIHSSQGVYEAKLHTHEVVRKFRTVARFYQRRGHVTPAKMSAWRAAQGTLNALEWLISTVDRFGSQVSAVGEERRALLLEEKAKRDAWVAKRKERKPNNDAPVKARRPSED